MMIIVLISINEIFFVCNNDIIEGISSHRNNLIKFSVQITAKFRISLMLDHDILTYMEGF